MAELEEAAVMDDKPAANLAWREFWRLVFLLARQAKLRESNTPPS